MFYRLPRVFIVFYVIAKYIPINSISRLNSIIFIMRAECVLCKDETNIYM